ncbi:terpene synthase family protein [Nocardia thraciensis]
MQWVQHHCLAVGAPLVDRYRAIAPGQFAALIYPQATVEGLWWIADWGSWLFTFDDHYCDEAALGYHAAAQARSVARLVNIIDDPTYVPDPGDPWATAFADLRDRFTTFGSAVQWARFASAFRAYMLGLTWEAAHRELGRCATLADYCTMRSHSSSMWTIVAIGDALCGYQLSDADFYDPLALRVTATMINIVCFANDIYSWVRESATQGPGIANLVGVLSEHTGRSVQDAVNEAVRMHDAELASYQRLLSDLQPHTSEPLRRYFDGLSAWLVGNGVWSLSTSRYGLADNYTFAEDQEPANARSRSDGRRRC